MSLSFSNPRKAALRIPPGSSGVYVIREALTGIIAYVGESHTGRLRKTMMRHFQAWQGQGSGPTFSRLVHEVAIIITDPGEAVTRQNALIADLQPAVNVQGQEGPLDF